MRIHVEDIVTNGKLPLVIAIAVSLIIILMTKYFFTDITLTLQVLIFLVSVLALSVITILYPFWGFLLIVAYSPFADLVELPLVNSGGRLVFAILAAGWFLRYFLQGKSEFFHLARSNRTIMLFIISMCISSIFAYKPLPSLAVSIEITTYIFMSFFIMQDVIDNERKLKIFITTIALSIGTVALFSIGDYFAHGSINAYGGVRRIGGFYSNPNSLGKTAMFGIPFILFISLNARSHLVKLLFSVLFIAAFYSIGLSVSRTWLIVFVIFAITYIALGLKHRIINVKKLLMMSLLFILLALLLSNFLIDNIEARASRDLTEDLRYFIFLKGIHALIEHPLVGIGFDNFKYFDTDDGKFGLILGGLGGHDIVSKVFASIGLVGTIILLMIFFRVIANMNGAARSFSFNRDKYWFNFIIILQAGYIALLSSGLGTSVILKCHLWIYYSLSVLMLKWGSLSGKDMHRPKLSKFRTVDKELLRIRRYSEDR
ncbi:MAG: O-antigen ligase family protein [Nitrospirae bacterium]|nr:O-antigen ligase family protein [Nitrospirota bacterium]